MQKFPYFRRLKYTKACLFRDTAFTYTYLRTDNTFSFSPLLSTFINTPHPPQLYTMWNEHFRNIHYTYKVPNSLLYSFIYFVGITAILSWNQCFVCHMLKSILNKISELESFEIYWLKRVMTAFVMFVVVEHVKSSPSFTEFANLLLCLQCTCCHWILLRNFVWPNTYLYHKKYWRSIEFSDSE
jgi:hypothetical protein